MRLRGPLHVAALAQSLQEIIRRHEVLRTTFVNVEGQPRQVIGPPPPYLCRWWSCRSCLSASGKCRSVRWRVRRPSGLSTWRKDRWCAPPSVRLATEEHVLLLTHASHCLRRLVPRGVLAGIGGALRGFRRWAARHHFLSSPYSMRTSPSGSGNGCRGRCWTHSLPTGSSSLPGFPRCSCPRTGRARRSRPSGAPGTPWSLSPSLTAGAQGAEPARRGHPVHDAAGSLSGPAAPLHRAGRHPSGLAYRQSQPASRPRS